QSSKVFVSMCLTFIIFVESCDAHGVDGIIPLLQQNFNIQDAQTATIRTASSIAQTVTLALIWILGDVFERRYWNIADAPTWFLCSRFLALPIYLPL
ncbi:hypothetical protein PENTCL1PPCAC_21766, partial [Pristionchus entomophagus]